MGATTPPPNTHQVQVSLLEAERWQELLVPNYMGRPTCPRPPQGMLQSPSTANQGALSSGFARSPKEKPSGKCQVSIARRKPSLRLRKQSYFQTCPHSGRWSFGPEPKPALLLKSSWRAMLQAGSSKGKADLPLLSSISILSTQQTYLSGWVRLRALSRFWWFHVSFKWL